MPLGVYPLRVKHFSALLPQVPVTNESPDPLFALEKQYPFFRGTPRRQKVAAWLDRVLGLAGLSEMPASVPEGHINPYQSGRQFMGVTIDGAEEFARQIPQEGPTLVVANHPYGAMDALVASELTLIARPDALIFGNAVLTHPCQDHCFLPLEIIDESPQARRDNLNSMRRALSHLKKGGCVLIFPAGEVERWRWSRLRIEEGAWTHHAARLAQKSNAVILPVAFPGENPLWFHLPGALHPLLRLLALPRAFLAMRGRTMIIKTGRPIPCLHLPSDPIDFTETLRSLILRMSNREDESVVK